MKSINLTKKMMTVTALLVLSFWMSNAIAAAELASMRIGQSDSKTRVVFDLTQTERYQVSVMSNPSRLVVDFYKTANKLNFKDKLITDTRLFKVRIYDTKARLRVVLDLHKSLNHQSFVTDKAKDGSESLVIDLTDLNSANMTAKSQSKSPQVAQVKAAVAKTGSKTSSKTKITPALEKSKPAVQVAKSTKENRKPAKVSQPESRSNVVTQSLLNQDSSVFADSKMLVVAIDAGHGGNDVGAIGHGRVYEKVVTLQMAKELKRLIDRQPGMRAILTRDKDVYIELKERVKIAKQQKADIFISVHADAFHDKSARGGTVYVLSKGGASSVMAGVLARSENASLKDVKLKGMDDDVAYALSDLTREANIRASRKLGHTVLHEMKKSVAMHRDSVQSARFAVLKSIDMPSLLIETAFISNPQEARNLTSRAFQAKMANAIVTGLTKYAGHANPKSGGVDSLYVYHKVQKGDTLSEIAEQYNVSTAVLKKLNNIKNEHEVYVGRKMMIPSSDKLVARL